MLRRTLALVIMLTLALAAAAAEKKPSLPAELPPYGPLKGFTAPQVSEQKLENGLTVWLVARPGFPKVAIALTVRGGLAADAGDRPGLAEFLAETVDQGTNTRNARQIAEQMQAAGGDLSAAARADSLLLAADVLSAQAEAGLSILADVARNAAFPDAEVEVARRNLADSLRQREAQPRFQATRALARILFGKHAYAVVAPTQDSIAKTSAAELRNEYTRRFRPDQALLVLVGDFDAARMMDLVRAQFGSWKAPAHAAVGSVEAPGAQPPHAFFTLPREHSVQTTLVLGAFGPTRAAEDFAAAEVANAIYGGMFGSRLVGNIREDKGYTYSPGSGIQMRRAAGLLRTFADVRNPVTGAALNEIAYELNRMATTAPTDEELNRARRYLVGTTAIDLQSREAVASELATLWVYGLPPAQLGRESDDIQKVTADQVAQAGRKYFPLARMTTIAVGDEKVIREELAPLGIEARPVP